MSQSGAWGGSGVGRRGYADSGTHGVERSRLDCTVHRSQTLAQTASGASFDMSGRRGRRGVAGVGVAVTGTRGGE